MFYLNFHKFTNLTGLMKHFFRKNINNEIGKINIDPLRIILLFR